MQTVLIYNVISSHYLSGGDCLCFSLSYDTIISVIKMNFNWMDYDTSMNFVETWLDAEAIKATGLDDGFRDFFEYWRNENNLNKDYWCKVIAENNNPFAVITIGKDEEKFIFMEFVISPDMRNQGKGTMILRELLKESKTILSQEIRYAEAVIYPSNHASKKAFEKSGFIFSYAHEDGDSLYYTYHK